MTTFVFHFIPEIQDIFLKILENEEDISVGIAAIKTLLAVIEQYKGISHTFSYALHHAIMHVEFAWLRQSCTSEV